MRERNSELNQNIGELVDEINNQELESVNGGREHNVNSTVGCAVASAVVSKTIDISADLVDKITKAKKCSYVPTATKECMC